MVGLFTNVYCRFPGFCRFQFCLMFEVLNTLRSFPIRVIDGHRIFNIRISMNIDPRYLKRNVFFSSTISHLILPRRFCRLHSFISFGVYLSISLSVKLWSLIHFEWNCRPSSDRSCAQILLYLLKLDFINQMQIWVNKEILYNNTTETEYRELIS